MTSVRTTEANIHDITFGTGYSIFKNTILPAIESARHEVILVTCFWADSQTRDALNDTLLKLSSAALQQQRTIRVRIGFSSCSLFQKLCHTSASEGRTYRASEWTKTLGLPSKIDLGGLDLEVKSIFFLPFSVWHPKFVVVDGKRAFLPSCNVSWEDWFEGCVEMTGPIVEQFLEFWRENWASDGDWNKSEPGAEITGLSGLDFASTARAPDGDEAAIHLNEVACQFLPSWHNCNPRWRLPWQQCAPPPNTPLNVQLLALFTNAKSEIFLQTPNVTSPPVLQALFEALQRGVAVSITTSERLMILEQLVTAGTTTSHCIKNLVKRHRLLLQPPQRDEERALVFPGRLIVKYYEPLPESQSIGTEPVQSHLKLTIVDHVIVYGSGNMDRASWYTSQELGVAFFSKDLCDQSKQKLDEAMRGRTKLIYDSGAQVVTRPNDVD